MPDDSRAVEAATPSVTEQLDALFAPWRRTDEPGLVVGAVKDGRLIYRQAFGMASLEHGVANTPTTRMRIGSISKHFTCLLALLLAEDGKFDLDQPIRAYIPELAGPGGDPTPRQLMQHRGGSRCYLDVGFIGHGFSLPPLGTVLKAQARQQGRNFAPGEAMIYNNGGYNLISIALERVGGAPFEAQVKARLFDPVGMPDTASVPTDNDIIPGVATFHMPRRGGRWRRGLLWTDELRGEGAIVSTVDDMLRWMAHLRTRDRFGSPATWAQLTEQPRNADGRLGAYALGLGIGQRRGLDIVQHSGGVAGGTAQMLLLPNDGLDVFMMANGARDADLVALSHQVVDIVLADRVGPETPKVAAEDYKPWLGDWWSPETRMVYSLVDQQGSLALTMAMGVAGAPLELTADGRLVQPTTGIGEIEITPGPGEALTIRFGPGAATYERLSATAEDQAAFTASAVGTYFSHDADATATIAAEGETLTIRTCDGLGEVTAPLIPLSASVGYSKPTSLLAQLRTTISLDAENGRASGFQLCTPRTRNLAFRRL
ncbi:MAG TPA: serine hydrolase domain-containing protein [Caulobacteraceae bacterium]|nr:serine hydrolase domain-containing protein [Caulobacteraceae bacterium]